MKATSILRTGLGGLGLILGLGVLATALLSQGGRVSATLDVFTHFAPIYLAAAVLAVLLAAGAEGVLRPAGMAAGLAAIVATGALILPELLSLHAGPRPVANAPSFKVIQFNAWGGNSRGAAASRWLLAQNADAIIVQEARQVAEALQDAGYRASCESCAVSVFTRQAPVSTVPHDRYETRGNPYLSAATIITPQGKVTIVGVHRPWPTRFAQDREDTAKLERYVSTLGDKRLAIIGGDFNSTPWSFKRRSEDKRFGLIRRTRALFTWPAERVSHNRLPAPFPYLPIDHIYAGAGWASIAVERGPRLGSDHYPIVVTLAPAMR